MKHCIFLKSLISCLLFCPLHAAEQQNTMQEDALPSFVIQFNGYLSSSKILTSDDGTDQQYIFILSDGTRWMTNSEKDFHDITRMGWSIGDRLTITSTEDCWRVFNSDRNHELTLLQLCNKRGA